MAVDTEEQRDSNTDKKILRRKLINSPEGKVFILGLILMLVYIAVLVVAYFVSAEKFRVLVGMAITNVIFGRAASLSFGYTMHMDHTTIMLLTMYCETVMVFLIYPLFIFSWKQLIVTRVTSNFVKKISKAAEINRGKIQKYGIMGLLIFVWFPFYMTGPVVGCVIGYLIGIRMWLTLTIVLSGTYLATVCWAVFLRELHEYVAVFNPYVPFMLLIIIILIVVVCRFLYNAKHKENTRK